MAPLKQLGGYVMADKGSLVLHYRGGETDAGEMGYYTAATAMMAFGDLMGIMSRAAYGDGSKVETKVRTVSPTGSISFEFLVQTVGVGQALLMAPETVGAMWELLKQCVEAWKFLKGKPAKSIERRQDGNFALTNINGDVKYFTQNVTVVINNSNAGDAIEQLIKKPMEQAGITEVALEEKDKEDQINIDRADKDCFTDVSRIQNVLESTAERVLYIESVKFREGNKWEFFDGQSRFSAALLDNEFIARINNGESFAKGDILVVDLHSTQKLKRNRLLVEHEIVRVKSHHSRSQQLEL
jgi:hypothetical protein